MSRLIQWFQKTFRNPYKKHLKKLKRFDPSETQRKAGAPYNARIFGYLTLIEERSQSSPRQFTLLIHPKPTISGLAGFRYKITGIETSSDEPSLLNAFLHLKGYIATLNVITLYKSYQIRCSISAKPQDLTCTIASSPTDAREQRPYETKTYKPYAVLDEHPGHTLSPEARRLWIAHSVTIMRDNMTAYEIKLARRSIALALHPDTLPPEKRAPASEALAYANNVLDQLNSR